MKWILILGLAVTCGCNTFRTTAVDRCENDTLVVNPEHPMKGIPVSLRVPTHLELSVVETTYWEKQDVPGGKPTLVPLHTCRPTRTVTHNVCYTEKIFLVDPVRPGAGIQNYGFTFTSNKDGNKQDAGKGYLDKVSYKIDDQTIKESANLLANSLSLISAFQVSAVNDPNLNTGDLIATDRTIAYTRLDINSPCFENGVENFLDTNVNQACNACTICPRVC
ncbi:MAG: hypothetical protein KDB00_08460, partial [Planctomycetales bacterium]|nr:hypothetical protein [Planctomycetales bacterium]